MVMFNDEYLEYWGAVFVAARLLEQGIPFQEFLEDPWGCLKVVGFQSAPPSVACGYRPLLPHQVKVAQALWRHWELETDGADQRYRNRMKGRCFWKKRTAKYEAP
jgi:hypothetical protein